METLVESIRLAVAADASPEARASGAEACRAILNALDPEPPPPSAVQANAAHTTAQIAQLATALRGVPVDQLLDLAITKLRTMVPAAPAASRAAFSVPLVTVPRS